jgi:hypothetical protein
LVAAVGSGIIVPMPTASKPSQPSKIELSARLPQGFRMHVAQLQTIAAEWIRSGTVADTKQVWRPKAAYTVIDGDLVTAGNLVIGTGKHDYGAVIVTGSIKCKNLLVSSGFSLACAGALTVAEVIVATQGDSTTYVAGPINAKLVISGSGAWLTTFSPKQLGRTPVSGYVMVGNKPSKETTVDLGKRLISAVVNDEEWRAMDPEDRVGEKASDYVQLEDSKVSKHLAAGKSILR